MPVSVGTNSLDRKRNCEEQRNLADYTDSQTDMSKAAEESSLATGDGSSWHSVYSPTTVQVKYESRPGIGRYVQSLKHLLPVRVKTGPGSYMPVDMSGCCAFTFFSWLTPLVWRTLRRGLVQADLYHCSPLDSCCVNGTRFSSMWEKHSQKEGLEKTQLSSQLFRFVRTRYFMSCLMYVLCVAFGFVGPTVFMRLLLEYVQKPAIDHIEGITWMLCLIACEFFRITLFGLMWAINIRTAIRASSAMMSLLYRKITKLRSISSTSGGEIINLFANDCQKVFMLVYNAPLIIGGPLLIVGTVIYTWWLLGPFCFVGVAVFVITYVFQFGISYLIAHFRKKAIKATDERVSLMSEFLTNIKLIKLYAWENPLMETVRDARSNERGFLEKCQYLQTLSSSVASMTAILATVFTILAYTLFGNDLTPAEAFTLVMVNSVASHGIRTLPMCIRDIVNGSVALSRLQGIMHMEDKQSYTTFPSNPEHAVFMSKATLDWEPPLSFSNAQQKDKKKGEVNLTVTDNEKVVPSDEISPDAALVTVQLETHLPPTLADINFILPKGKLIGVCGAVGSGKSSLISALLGQMCLLSGQVAVRGSTAYVPQQPWILNSTLKENILFGQLFSSKRYYEAVYCCGLTDDLASLPAGDQTEVGEKGVTLSGGQKQRVSLARAQYADKEVYLLDDPLSSVDSQVGRHIFQHCIKGALKGKSILFVTYQLKYLQECDSIILMRDGRIVDHGSHEELSGRDSEYSALLQVYSKDDEMKGDVTEDREVHTPSPDIYYSPRRSPSLTGSLSDLDETDINDGHLTTNEKITSGNVSCDTFEAYIRAAGGFIVCSLVLVWFILQSASAAFSKYWLSYWLAQGDGNTTQNEVEDADEEYIETVSSGINANPDLGFYQLIYGLSIAMMFTISIILGFLFTKTSLRASSGLHDRILQKVFRSPMHFFDITPTGRILNIFTHDTDEVDIHLPTVMVAFLQRMTTVIFALLLVVIVYYWFIVPLVVLAGCFIFVQRLFRAIMRDLKRMENVSRSPIFSHIGATIQGLPTIRAFQKQDDFLERFTQYVDQHSSPQYLYYCSMRWLGTRMDILCLLITIITALFVVFLKGESEPAFAALALVLAMQLSGMYQFVVRLGCDLETRFTSVERIQSYSEELETEAPAVIEKTRPSPDWPTRGRICFVDVKMRYRVGLPLALKGLTFDIEPQEKVGIVGRTGAGKSSVGIVLFRLVEITSGSIFIDGVNIRDLGLDDLRSRMSIIPQDPILFQGSIRYNLDPLGLYSEKELWDVVERTHMKEKVASLEEGLESSVNEGGDNFSVGEKQLLCMARALLRHSKPVSSPQSLGCIHQIVFGTYRNLQVVVLDEATSSIDTETDSLIQKTVSEVFHDSTVITIAHRLTTVMNCDRVMVLSEGKIVEFDKPAVLLGNTKSHFSRLMAAYKSSRNL